MGNLMSECHSLDQQSGSLVDRLDDTPSLIFFVRVSIDPQLRKGRSPTITPAVNSDISAVKVFELVVGNSPHLKLDEKRKKQATELFWGYIYMLLCVPLYENCSFLRSLGWSEREQKPLVQVFCSIQETQCTLLDWSSHIHCGLPFGHFGFSWKNDQSTTLPPTGKN